MYYHRNQAPFIAEKNHLLAEKSRIAGEFKLAIRSGSHDTFKRLLGYYLDHFNQEIMKEVAKSPLMEFVHLVLLSDRGNYIFDHSGQMYEADLIRNKKFINCVIQGHITTIYGTDQLPVPSKISLQYEIIIGLSVSRAETLINNICNDVLNTNINYYKLVEKCITCDYCPSIYFPLIEHTNLKTPKYADDIFFLLINKYDNLNERLSSDETNKIKFHQIIEQTWNAMKIRTLPKILSYLKRHKLLVHPKIVLLENLILANINPTHLIFQISYFNVYTLSYCPIRLLRFFINNCDESWDEVEKTIAEQLSTHEIKCKYSNKRAGARTKQQIEWCLNHYRRMLSLQGTCFEKSPDKIRLKLSYEYLFQFCPHIQLITKNAISTRPEEFTKYMSFNTLEGLKTILLIRNYEDTILSMVPNEIIFSIYSFIFEF
jgi:hypothetical protein